MSHTPSLGLTWLWNRYKLGFTFKIVIGEHAPGALVRDRRRAELPGSDHHRLLWTKCSVSIQELLGKTEFTHPAELDAPLVERGRLVGRRGRDIGLDAAQTVTKHRDAVLRSACNDSY